MQPNTNIFVKIKDRLGKNSNGIFRNILYQLEKSTLLHVTPKIAVNLSFINETNCVKVKDIQDEKMVNIFKNKLTNGEIGIFASVDENCIAYCWVVVGDSCNLKRVNELLSLSIGEAYIHYCYTVPMYRGKNIFPFLLSKISDHIFRNKETDIIYIDTTTENMPSQKGVRKVGFRKKCIIERLKIFNKIIFRRDINTYTI